MADYDDVLRLAQEVMALMFEHLENFEAGRPTLDHDVLTRIGQEFDDIKELGSHEAQAEYIRLLKILRPAPVN